MSSPEEDPELALAASLDLAWADLEEGEPEDALARVAGLSEEHGEAALIEVWAFLGLGDHLRAEAALERAASLVPPAEPQLLRTRAELSLARWRARDALGTFSSIPDALQQPEILERLALCAELLGDYETADAHFERAQRLEPLEHPAPPRLDPEEFDAVVQEGVDQLPPELAVALERVAVVIDPMPTHELCGDDPVETPPELLGLFVGPSLLDQSFESSGELPPTVYLFQRNLERVCGDREQLVEEIRITLFHELGHALGFDEDGVARMGLE